MQFKPAIVFNCTSVSYRKMTALELIYINNKTSQERMMDSQDLDRRPQKQQQIYKRISLLGSGSYGKAYLVKHIKQDTLWVVKQINMGELSPDQQQKALREAKILQVLNHPNIVKFKEVYRTAKGKLNIVMEYADGGDLSTRMKQAKSQNKYFDESQILNWFTQICLAVKHIHDRKIIHRDLKGQNIFLTKQNLVKVGDFGVSAVLQRTISKAKTVVGSPYYLSPEIISNQPYSFATDIWSLGAILFEMCSLSPPFTANNLQFLALKIVKGSYSSIPGQYSQDLKNLIRSMLNVRAQRRPSINEILCSKALSNRIKKFLTESQKLHQFSHTVLHNKNVFGFNKENSRQNVNPSQLRPPPNLMQNNDSDIPMENSSHITVPSEKQDLDFKNPPSMNQFHKAPKTSQGPKKGANNFFNRPSSNRERNHMKNDLTDLIQIKPTAIEHQQKVEKVKLPHVPPPVIVTRKKMETPKPISRKSSVQKDINKVPEINKHRPTPELQKKRQSVTANAYKHEQPQTPKTANSYRKRESEVRKPVSNTGKLIQKKQSTTNLNKKPTTNSSVRAAKKQTVKQGPQISNGFKKNKSKDSKAPKEEKIEVASQQFKKKNPQIKIKSTGPKNKSSIKQRPPKAKKQTVQEKVQEQKVNAQNDLEQYEQEKFEPYQMNGQFEQEYQDSEISLDLSESEGPPIKGQKKDTYLQIISQMQNIQKYVEEAQGAAANLPVFGELLPQILLLSNQIREDDTEFDTMTNLNLRRIDQLASELGSEESIMKTTQNVNLTCFQDHNQLESLRMNLQDIFGLQNLLFAYKEIQSTINQRNLDFDEQQTIRSILRNKQIDECLLRKYFRLIVTVIALEHELILNEKQ